MYHLPAFGYNDYECAVTILIILIILAVAWPNFSYLWTVVIDLRRRLYVFEFWTYTLDGRLETEQSHGDFAIEIPTQQASNYEELIANNPELADAYRKTQINPQDASNLELHSEKSKPMMDNGNTTGSETKFYIKHIDIRDFRAVFHWYRMILATKDFGKRYYQRLQSYASFFLISIFLVAILVIFIVSVNISGMNEKMRLEVIFGVTLDLKEIDVFIGLYIILLTCLLLLIIVVVVYHGM